MEKTVPPSQSHPECRDWSKVSEWIKDRDRRRQATDKIREQIMDANNTRGLELSITSQKRPIRNWQKLPYEFRCRDMAIAEPGIGPNSTFWFAETDTIYVPAILGGPADIPISREGMIYITPIPKCVFVDRGEFWGLRRKRLEELRLTGRLASRDKDRWGRPWNEHHAGLGKEQRKYGKQDSITIFDLGCDGGRKITKPWWEYKMSMFIADAATRE